MKSNDTAIIKVEKIALSSSRDSCSCICYWVPSLSFKNTITCFFFLKDNYKFSIAYVVEFETLDMFLVASLNFKEFLLLVCGVGFSDSNSFSYIPRTLFYLIVCLLSSQPTNIYNLLISCSCRSCPVSFYLYFLYYLLHPVTANKCFFTFLI